MILGYKKYWPWGGFTNFAQKIIQGTKLHSIRVDKKSRWHAGIKIQHAHGVRTKRYLNFANGECISTQNILIEDIDKKEEMSYTLKVILLKIDFTKVFRVKVDGKVLDRKTIVQLAHNDGFNSADDFFNWFIDGFEGKIIHFTDLRY